MQEHAGLTVYFDPAMLSDHALGVLRLIADRMAVDHPVRATRLFKFLRKILDEEVFCRTLDRESRQLPRRNPVITDIMSWGPNDVGAAVGALAVLISSDALSPEVRTVIYALNLAMATFAAAILRHAAKHQVIDSPAQAAIVSPVVEVKG